MRKILASLATVLAVFVSSPAQAQWLVKDPANLAQNIMSVMTLLKQEAAQAQQLINQYQQLQNEYRQLKSLAEGDVRGLLSTIEPALANQQDYLGEVKALYGDLTDAKTIVMDIYKQMGASALSPEEWFEREAKWNQSRQEGLGFLTKHQANVLGQVEKRYQAVRDMQSKITTTEGSHESMQLMNSQMNVLVATTNQMLEQNAIMAQRATVREAEELGRQKAKDDISKALLEAEKNSHDNTMRNINHMINPVGGR